MGIVLKNVKNALKLSNMASANIPDSWEEFNKLSEAHMAAASVYTKYSSQGKRGPRFTPPKKKRKKNK